ncbi:MAG: YgiQ family radical SAM protein, partial [Gammaproteobacteria bacterium]
MRSHQSVPHLNSFPRYWAECYGIAPFLPMSRQEMDELGWDSCDIILVTGDAYIDHPSFGMAVMGRLLESQGYRVGIIAQPEWRDIEDFTRLGKPNLYYGVTAGNMDSLINHYTADKRLRSDDAYTPHGEAGKRPDRAVIVYSQRCREAFLDTPIVIGGIEASLRRIAQYDYWSDQVRRSILIDSGADILLYGNAERAILELSNHLARGRKIDELEFLRGSAIIRERVPHGWTELDSSRIDWPGKIDEIQNPYIYEHQSRCQSEDKTENPPDEVSVRVVPMPLRRRHKLDPDKTCIRLPSYNKVKNDPVLYAHASRVLHQETNPYNARPL